MSVQGVSNKCFDKSISGHCVGTFSFTPPKKAHSTTPLCAVACSQTDRLMPPANDPKSTIAWRLLTTNFVLVDVQELVLAMLLIYQFRMLERRLGTSKYAAFVVFAFAVGQGARYAVGAGGLAVRLATGPYSLVFACFPLLVRAWGVCRSRARTPICVCVCVEGGRGGETEPPSDPQVREIPSSKAFQIAGVSFSARAWYYLLGVQVAEGRATGSVTVFLAVGYPGKHVRFRNHSAA